MVDKVDQRRDGRPTAGRCPLPGLFCSAPRARRSAPGCQRWQTRPAVLAVEQDPARRAAGRCRRKVTVTSNVAAADALLKITQLPRSGRSRTNRTPHPPATPPPLAARAGCPPPPGRPTPPPPPAHPQTGLGTPRPGSTPIRSPGRARPAPPTPAPGLLPALGSDIAPTPSLIRQVAPLPGPGPRLAQLRVATTERLHRQHESMCQSCHPCHAIRRDHHHDR